MAVIREHLATKGLGLHNDLQNEHSIVGNNVGLLLMLEYGTDEQKAEWVDDLAARATAASPSASPSRSTARTPRTWRPHAVRDGDEWVINGEKTWNTGIHKAQYDLIFARTSGNPGDGDGITAFLTPTDSPGFEIVEFLWTFNMPTDHAHVSAHRRARAALGRSSAARAAASASCSTSSTRTASARPRPASARRSSASTSRSTYARERKPFGKPLSTNQAIQFPLVELQTQCEMLRALIHKTAWGMDTYGAFSQSDKVSMCNYWANRLCCEAADRAMQVHGGLGYSRHKPFEHIYRHHRRYRITEGAEEIQMRRVAGYMFGYMKQQAPKGVGRHDLAETPCSSYPPRPSCWRRSAGCSTSRSSPPSRRTCSTRCASPPTSPGIVERELRLGPANAARERELIARAARRATSTTRRRRSPSALRDGDDDDVRGAGVDRRSSRSPATTSPSPSPATTAGRASERVSPGDRRPARRSAHADLG